MRRVYSSLDAAPRRVYQWLLAAAPRRVRISYGSDMAETFDALYADASSRGAIAVQRLLIAELASLVSAHWIVRREDMTAILQNVLSFTRLRQALRSLRRRPGFALSAIAMLAFATAATTTVFAVVNTVLLQPLPYPSADRLVTVFESMPSKSDKTSLIAPPRLVDWQRMNTSFDAVSASYAENVTDTSTPMPERLQGRRVMPSYFNVFGVSPVVGRVFSQEEERFEGPGAVVISDGLWQRRFQRASSAVGTSMLFGGKPFVIVGVMPPLFAAPTVEVFLPAQMPPFLMTLRDNRFLTGVGRLKAGVTIDAARADLALVQQRLGEQFPATDKDWRAALTNLRDARVSGDARTLWLVFGAILMLWLIGVTNIAGIMLVQLQRRAREFAVRAAIGGSRADIAGAVLSEVMLIVAAGSVIGLALAAACLYAVPAVFTALPRMNELHLEWRAALFAVASSAIAALIFGVWPALRAARGQLAQTMTLSARGSSGKRHAMQHVLVAAQVALSLLLAGSAGLLMRSYYNLTNVDTGFSTDGVMTFHVGARWDEDRIKVGALQTQLLERLAAVPGVEAAGMANFLPMDGATLRAKVVVDGITGPERDGTMSAGTRMVSSGYLPTLSVPLVKGEACSPLKTDFNARGQVLVNASFVSRFADGRDIVGRTLAVQGARGGYTIAGVVGDIVEDTPTSQAAPYIYTCDSAGSWPDPEYVVRTRDVRAFPAALRDVVKQIDPNRAVFSLQTLDAMTSDLRQTPRLNAGVVMMFAGAALLVAAMGLYSLFMLLVSERVREIGVRLALGASPIVVIRLVLDGALKLLAIGVGCGLALNFAAQKIIGASLFHVAPNDPLILAGAVAVLAAVSALAVAVPALRASRVDPMIAMKAE